MQHLSRIIKWLSYFVLITCLAYLLFNILGWITFSLIAEMCAILSGILLMIFLLVYIEELYEYELYRDVLAECRKELDKMLKELKDNNKDGTERSGR